MLGLCKFVPEFSQHLFITQTHDSKLHSKHEAENRVNDGEWNQVFYDKTKHSDDGGEVFKYSEEKESFTHAEEKNNSHGGLAEGFERRVDGVENYLSNAGEHVNEVDYVPEVSEVVLWPHSEHLANVV